MRSKVRHIHLKTWVFATSNGTKKLSEPLLSRFRVMYLNEYKYNIKKKFGFQIGIGLGTSGECLRESHTVFVNTHLQWFCREKYLPNGKVITQHVKPRFEDFYRVLVHELVHYRWSSLIHGYGFEERVTAILRGKKYA